MTNVAPEGHVHVDEKRRKLLACVDQVLTRLGPDVRRALAYYMRREHSLKHYEIPDNPREFSLALHHIFGRSSSGIERQITQAIVDEFHLKPDIAPSFEKAVQAALSNGT